MKRITRIIRPIICMAVLLFAMTTAVMGCYQKETEPIDIPGRTPFGTYIERATYELRRERRVRVATSDGPEQVIILGHGALRVSARAFHAEVEAAARAARCDHFIHTLAGGYDFMINEEGTNLSQGQRQLVTIARAILADRPALILDEATSNVDTRTEELIQRAMDALMQGRTSFVIAHRLSTIRNADVILVIRDGDIVEKGTHDELLAQGGFYADLYNSQFDEAA